MQAGVFHRKEVVARGNAGTAHVDDVARRVRTEDGIEFRSQLRGLFESTIRIKVVRKRTVVRTRNVPGDAIDRLDLAAIAWRTARVEQ